MVPTQLQVTLPVVLLPCSLQLTKREMGTIIYQSLVSFAAPLRPHCFPFQLLNPTLGAKSITFRNKTATSGSRSGESNESVFEDENGVIDDMDGYLNRLSLEYDSVWDTKPAWCQPWTITLTGVLVIACSWIILHSVVVTSVVLFLICAWWFIFLYSYPKAYSEMIAERRKKVTDGIEDTFGLRKSR